MRRDVHIVRLAFVFCTLASLLTWPASADDSDLVSVQGFAVHGYSGGKEIGYDWYRTRAEAEAARTRMLATKTTIGNYYDRVDITPETHKVPRELNPPKPKTKPNTKPGDVLSEYKDRVAKAYHKAVEAKRNLLAGTQRIADGKLREANSLIASYNSQRDDFVQRSGRAPADLPLLAPVSAADLPGRTGDDRAATGKFTVWVYKKSGSQWVRQPERTLTTDESERAQKYVDSVNAIAGWRATSNLPKREPLNLAGRHGRGTFMDGVTPLNVDFQAGGVAFFGTADERLQGTWAVSGDQITMVGGASTLRGHIEGNRMAGTVSRTNGSRIVDGKRLSDRQGTWDLTLDE